MKKFHSFYVIGTIGILVSAALHITLTFITKSPDVHVGLFPLYASFLSLLIVGTARMITRKQTAH